MNYSTSAGGSLKTELQNAAGEPLQGFALADCKTLVGDSIEQQVRWENDRDLSATAGMPVRLRFVMQEADLFSLRFAGGRT